MSVTLYVQPKPLSPSVTLVPPPKYQLPSWCVPKPSLDTEEVECLNDSWMILLGGDPQGYRASATFKSKQIAAEHEISELFTERAVDNKKETTHPTPSKSSAPSQSDVPPLKLPSTVLSRTLLQVPPLGTPKFSAHRFKPGPIKPAPKTSAISFLVHSIIKGAKLNEFPFIDRFHDPKEQLTHLFQLVIAGAAILSEQGTANFKLTVSYLNGFWLDYSQWNEIFTQMLQGVRKTLGADATPKVQAAWKKAFNLFLIHVMPRVDTPSQIFVEKPVFQASPMEVLFQPPAQTAPSKHHKCCTIM